MSNRLLKLLSNLDYLIGCTLLIPASYALIYSQLYLWESILYYIISCGFLLKAAIIDLYSYYLQVKKTSDESLIESKSKKSNDFSFSIVLFLFLGGLFFEIGSILYWPSFNSTSRVGTWVFRVGSCCYLTASLMSLDNLLRPYELSENSDESKKKNSSFYLYLICIICYIFGAILFIIGGILSEAGYKLSGETWMAGSVLFCVGSISSSIEFFKSYK